MNRQPLVCTPVFLHMYQAGYRYGMTNEGFVSLISKVNSEKEEITRRFSRFVLIVMQD